MRFSIRRCDGSRRTRPCGKRASRSCFRTKNNGEISNYYPDFLVKRSPREVFIVETKGQEDLDVPLKMQRLKQWCEDINRVQSDVTYDFVYVDEKGFEQYKPTSFNSLLAGFREYKD